MRIVQEESELASSYKASKSEALSSFGDDRVYIEKYIENPRHIEVQVLADKHGNAIHLGERECSIQRRHQKIIEESPSTLIDDNIREQLTKAAIKLVKSSGYTNAGTLEFIFDEDRNFFFLEMNTRLQVEHPVTEMRVGIDIVREQIRIAESKPLSLEQKDVIFNGHAIECRVYAEDPSNNFFPSIGKIYALKALMGYGIREDRGIEEGNEITPYYDPIISKLVVWGKTRIETIKRMISALDNYEIFGVRNNIALCSWIMKHPNFENGKFDTNFLTKYFQPELLEQLPTDILHAGAITAIQYSKMLHSIQPIKGDGDVVSKWKKKISKFMR